MSLFSLDWRQAQGTLSPTVFDLLQMGQDKGKIPGSFYHINLLERERERESARERERAQERGRRVLVCAKEGRIERTKQIQNSSPRADSFTLVA